MISIVLPLLVYSAPVANPPPPVQVVAAAPAATDKDGAKPKAENFDIGQLLTVFEKLFPAQPEPPPARLALSRTAVQGLLPSGAYGRLVGDMMGGMVERVLGMSEADFGKKGDKDKPPSTATLREQLIKDDPHFEERMRITERVLSEEMAKVSAIIEPRLREGLARSMARRFDERQLADLNAFLATDSGRAFGQQSMAMWVDPDVMRSMVTAFPDLFKAMPAAFKRLEAETAHLPKPKGKEEKKDRK